ncbi:MAG: 4a-hydroxytetrahydrobiopterin dehydratase [Catenulispora sp.]|nr:4a-hydroxytetrahydrobiopterin dehydratase [Catenulispora sp.]
MSILEQEEIQRRLAALPEWSTDGESLIREYSAADFPAAIALVDRVAVVAEEVGHHPDIDVRWRTVTFRLSTHSAGGITEADVEMAGRVEGVIGAA